MKDYANRDTRLIQELTNSLREKSAELELALEQIIEFKKAFVYIKKHGLEVGLSKYGNTLHKK